MRARLDFEIQFSKSNIFKIEGIKMQTIHIKIYEVHPVQVMLSEVRSILFI